MDTKTEQVVDMLRDHGDNSSLNQVKKWLAHRKATAERPLTRITVHKEHGVKVAPMEVPDND